MKKNLLKHKNAGVATIGSIKVFVFLISCLILLKPGDGFGQNYTRTSISPSLSSLSSPVYAFTGASDVDDSYNGPYSIPFSFQFYGQSVTQFYLTTNGLVMFGSPSSAYTPQNIPSADAVNNMVAIWCDQYVYQGYGHFIRYQTIGAAPNRVLVIDYNVSDISNPTYNIRFQVKLYETTNIVEQHIIQLGTYSGRNTNIGIENQDGTQGISSWHSAQSNFGYRYTPTTTNLTISAAHVTGLPGTQVVVPVTVQDFNNMVTAQGSITYNTSIATLVGVEQYGLPNLASANFGTNTPGTVTYSWDDQTLQGVTLANNTTIFALRFNVVGALGSSTPVTFGNSPTPTEYTNTSLVPLTVTTSNGSITVPANFITTDPLASNSLCQGGLVSVAFTSSGTFNGGNTFTAQLSNASGSFASPQAIGTGTASPIAATIPSVIAPGSNYRIRVVSSSPAVIGTDNGSDITISPTPVATAASNSPVCVGAPINLTASGSTFYSWTGPNGFTSLQQNPVIPAATSAMAGVYSVTVSNGGGCSDVATVNVTVNEAPVFTSCPTNQTVNATASCNAVVTYATTITGTPAPAVTYTFTGATTGSGNGNGSGSTFNTGTTTVTVSATNTCTTTDCSFTITVEDNEAPVLTCPANITVNNDASTCGAVVNFTAPTATDNCGTAAAGNQTFSFTGAMQTFTAPVAGTYTLETWGAQGGSITSAYPTDGGLGGYATGTVSLAAGQTINIYVGGQGQEVISSPNCTYMAGGWNGGGAVRTQHLGASGGGASDIRINGTGLTDRILVAGGGGGSAIFYAAGGAGGGLAGGNGTGSQFGQNTYGYGAFGGSQSAGGAVGPSNFGCSKTAGALGIGGEGSGNALGGGGGGGGYYGGGGGGYADGGGGGSSFTGGVTAGSTNQGVRSGNGQVVISWAGSGGNTIAVTQTAGLPSGSVFPVGTTTNTFSATDASGNTSTCSFDIVVTDTENPVITCLADIQTCDVAPGSLGTPTTSDNCAVASVTNDAPASFPMGTTVVTWTVTDVNGNTATCTQNVTVTATPATPIASYNNPLSAGSTLQLSATTISGATYSWTGPNGFTSTLQNPTISNVSGLHAGTYSVTAVINGCSSAVATVNVDLILAVSGVVRSEHNTPINTVTLTTTGGAAQNSTTNATGAYTFNFNSGGNYTVVAEKSNDVVANNGVTTLDIALVRRHLLGVQALGSPYKILAADVNGSDAVTTADIAQMRSVILTTTSSFNGQQWKFVPGNYVFANPANPFPYNASVSTLALNNLTSSQTVDFIGLKLGDVNNTWDNTIARLQFAGDLHMLLPSRQTQPQDTVLVPVRVKDFTNVSGYQFTMEWDKQVLQFIGVVPAALQGAYGQHQATNGKLTTTWDEPAGQSLSLADSTVIFQLKFKAIGAAGTVSPLNITSALTKAESYNSQLAPLNLLANTGQVLIGAVTGVSEGVSEGYAFFQNYPNPFSANTTFSFALPKAENIRLTIYNSLGQVVATHNAAYNAGEHQLELKDVHLVKNLPSGAYFVSFTAGGFTATKKMVVLK